MPHLNDPKLAAQLLSGISFTINHTSRGDFSLQHVKYDCTLSYGDGENDILHTSYQSVPSIHGEPSLTDVMMSLTSDAMVASDYDIDTFADEFGYAKPSQAIRAYEGCKKSLEWLRPVEWPLRRLLVPRYIMTASMRLARKEGFQ